MKHILFFDTETTGYPSKSIPLNDPKQPCIVQLAAQLVTDDDQTLMEFGVIVDNPGVESKEGALKVHGIDRMKASKYGITSSTAIDFFMHLHARADLMVAHNIEFDLQMITIAFFRRHGALPERKLPRFCTQHKSTQIARIPPTAKMVAAGRDHYKTPNLEEALGALLGEKLVGAHDALEDVRACRRIYFELVKRGVT